MKEDNLGATAGVTSQVTVIINQLAVPVGSVIAYSGTTDPPTDNIEGSVQWMLCDGRALDSRTYSALYNVVGNSFGNGTENNPAQIPQQFSFNIPDLRGRFIRGTDDMNGHAAKRDPDIADRVAMMTGGNTGVSADKIGSVQADSVGSHTHRMPGVYLDGTWEAGDPWIGYSKSGSYRDSNPSHPPPPPDGNETRPVNAYLNYLIRVA